MSSVDEFPFSHPELSTEVMQSSAPIQGFPRSEFIVHYICMKIDFTHIRTYVHCRVPIFQSNPLLIPVELRCICARMLSCFSVSVMCGRTLDTCFENHIQVRTC